MEGLLEKLVWRLTFLRSECGSDVSVLVAFPASALEAPPCVKLHGLLPAPKRQVVLNHEPALASRLGVHTVCTGGSGRHSS
eukprot:3398698-Amphidinium_carterae.2